MSDYIITYGNDTGTDDDFFCEWWTVSNGVRYFKCDTEEDAEWLRATLNNLKPEQNTQ